MSAVAVDMCGRARAQGAHLGALKFLSLGRSDAGCVRNLNEDAFVDRPDIGLWAVADGMGGHDAGDVASAAVADALSRVSTFRSAYGFRHAVCMALHGVNAELRARADESGGGVCGSTVAALIVHQGHFACLWAGDSRIYLYRAGEMRRLTRDHSVVQAMVDAGQLRDEEARHHDASHLITRAVGAKPALELGCVHGAISGGDRFLVCSDGLTGLVGDAELASFMHSGPMAASLNKMVSTALARGGHDNITAVLVAAEPR